MKGGESTEGRKEEVGGSEGEIEREKESSIALLASYFIS